MIRLVQGSRRSLFPQEIDEMHRLRAQVFHERLGWDVEVRDGWEIDRFDALDPLYLLSLDDDGHVRGSLRLLPTTGPNMLTRRQERAEHDPVLGLAERGRRALAEPAQPG